MIRRLLLVCMLLVPLTARAQGGPVDDAAATAASATPTPTATATATATPTPSTSADKPERPLRGPSVRERAGRRSRGASTASGALFMTILLGALGYWVLKRIRR